MPRQAQVARGTDRAAVCPAGAMRQDNGGTTPCCIVYTLKRESADEVAGRLTSKGKRSLLYFIAVLSTVWPPWPCSDFAGMALLH